MLILSGIMTRPLFIFQIFLIAALWSIPARAVAHPVLEEDKTAAVILAYHRIGEDSYPATNIRREQFEGHIRALVQGHYNIIALPTLIKALKNGTTLPPRTIALTFDGAHRSAYDIAVPLLLEHNLPFTLFLPTDRLDSGLSRYINWKDIKKLQRYKNVTIGLQPATYTHLNDTTPDDLRRTINKARARLREETGREALFFAYPFGEWSAAYRALIEEQGFLAAFGQQSGVAYSGHDLLTLPRFPMTESYAGLDRFRLIAGSLPLPVTDMTPPDPLLTESQPAIGFTVDEELTPLIDQLSCFISGQEKAVSENIGANRIELRLTQPFDEERNRINCTMPAPPDFNTGEPRWRWFGALFVLPEPHQE